MTEMRFLDEEIHKLTLRLPKTLHRSMQVRRGLTGQSITSQLIECAMKSERDFHQQLVPKQRVAHEAVMNTVYQ